MSRSYSNITLTSLGGDLSVVVYLPVGVGGHHKYDDEPYYYSSRFDHGSMIGSITRQKKRTSSHNSHSGSAGASEQQQHVLYGTDMWRMPHNSHWPESGVGLASEFGAGVDGALCDFRCGWPEAVSVTNGVLGYQEAANGDSFLKIGVGELLKGTCPACDSTDDYRFNSPYMFAKQPVWTMTRENNDDPNAAIQLEHQAVLRNYGYHLRKDISLTNNVLSVTTTLQNLGDAPFSTVWYSHNFFTCDRTAVGPGYTLDLDIKGESGHPVYEEPSTWSWSTPLQDYAKVKTYPNSVHVEMNRALDPGTRIKAEFVDDHVTTGGFTIAACETALESSLTSPYLATTSRNNNNNSPISMYAYNLYIERGTFSPEPQLLINNLQPGQSLSWTQLLVIHDDGFTRTDAAAAASALEMEQQAATPVAVNAIRPWWNLRGIGGGAALRPQQQLDSSLSSAHHRYYLDELVTYAGIVVAACCLLTLLLRSVTTRYRRRNYNDLG